MSLAHTNKVSLAVFKPARILDFVAKNADPDWPQDKLEAILNNLKQGHLFGGESLEDFKVMPKLPYKFSYRFGDERVPEVR